MRDPDGYTVVVANPYGSADGAWRPGPDLFTWPPVLKLPAMRANQGFTL